MNPPGSGAVRGLRPKHKVPGYHPKHGAIHAFTTVATAASLHAAPYAHRRAQMSASDNRCTSSVGTLWAQTLAQKSERRRICSHPVRSCWRCAGSARMVACRASYSKKRL